MSLSCNPIEFEKRVASIVPRIEQLFSRCSELDADVDKLTRNRKFPHDRTRGLFVEEILREVRDKLVEAKLVCENPTVITDEYEAQLATVERWVTSAADLVSRAIRVLDEVEDVFGKLLPRGGLWDK